MATRRLASVTGVDRRAFDRVRAGRAKMTGPNDIIRGTRGRHSVVMAIERNVNRRSLEQGNPRIARMLRCAPLSRPAAPTHTAFRPNRYARMAALQSAAPPRQSRHHGLPRSSAWVSTRRCGGARKVGAPQSTSLRTLPVLSLGLNCDRVMDEVCDTFEKIPYFCPIGNRVDRSFLGNDYRF